METSAQRVRQHVAQQAAEEAQQQSLAQRQGAATGQHCDCKQQHRAGHDDPGNGQAFHARHDKNGQAQPLRVGGEPTGNAIEPWAHTSTSFCFL